MFFYKSKLVLINAFITLFLMEGNLWADNLIIEEWNKSQRGQIDILKPNGEWAKINAPEIGLNAELDTNSGLVHMKNKDGLEYVFELGSVKKYKNISTSKEKICINKDHNGSSSGMGGC